MGAAVKHARSGHPEGATTVRDAAEELLAGLRDESVLNRSGERYKPSTVRSYEVVLRRHLLPTLGGRKLTDVRVDDVQTIVHRMRANGAEPSTVRNAVMPLRVIYRRAKLGVNPPPVSNSQRYGAGGNGSLPPPRPAS